MQGFEIPRVLFDDQVALEAYIKKSQNKALLKWWAQYQESLGNLDVAITYYTAADDQLSVVRLHCVNGNVEQAVSIVESTGDRAGAFQLARHYDNNEQAEEAVKYYSRSGCFSNAIRLAKEHNLKQLMMGLALRSTKADMIEVK